MVKWIAVVAGCATLWAASLLTFASQAPRHPTGLGKLQDFARQENLELLVFESGGRVHYVQGGAAKVIFGLAPEGASLGHHAYPTLSPDGKQIALVRPVAVGKELISLHSLTDGTQSDLRRWDGYVYGLSWSPAGKQIAFVAANSNSRTSMNILETGTGRIIEILPSSLGLEGRVSLDSPPSWSPDGERIAFEIDQSAGGPYKRAVAIVDVISQKGSLLAEGESPSWSPNGNVIAYHDLRKKNYLSIKPDGTGKKKLFSPYSLLGGPAWPGGLTLPLLWLPDEQMFGYNEMEGEGPVYSFSVRNLKNGNRRKVYSDSRLTVVAWRKAQRRE